MNEIKPRHPTKSEKENKQEGEVKGPVGPGTARVHGRQGRGMPGVGRSAKQGTRGCEKKGRVCQTCDSSGGSSRVCSRAKPGQGESPRRQAT